MPSARKLAHLTRRTEFLSVAASGIKWVRPGVIIQYLPCPPGSASSGSPYTSTPLSAPDQSPGVGPLRYGLTASKRVGGAVVRNRARRRLRAVAEMLLQSASAAGDYVLIARPETIARPFADLCEDVRQSLHHLARKAQEKNRSPS